MSCVTSMFRPFVMITSNLHIFLTLSLIHSPLQQHHVTSLSMSCDNLHHVCVLLKINSIGLFLTFIFLWFSINRINLNLIVNIFNVKFIPLDTKKFPCALEKRKQIYLLWSILRKINNVKIIVMHVE